MHSLQARRRPDFNNQATPATIIRCVLDQAPIQQHRAILLSLQLISAALRPLTVYELSAATRSAEGLVRRLKTLRNDSRDLHASVKDAEDLILCIQRLVIMDHKTSVITIRDNEIQDYLSSHHFGHDFEAMSSMELLAAMCADHLFCQYSSSVSTSACLCLRRGLPCTLTRYVAAFWLAHLREYERSSAFVRRAIHDSLLSYSGGSLSAKLACRRQCNRFLAVALQFCATYNFAILGQTYLEAGASLAACDHALDSPLAVARDCGSSDILKIFCRRDGADVDKTPRKVSEQADAIFQHMANLEINEETWCMVDVESL